MQHASDCAAATFAAGTTLHSSCDCCEHAAKHIALIESLLREAEKFCPRSLTGEEELANRIEKALNMGGQS